MGKEERFIIQPGEGLVEADMGMVEIMVILMVEMAELEPEGLAALLI